MRYDRAFDNTFRWHGSEAFREIGAELNALDPRSVVMYTSGRASLETSYMYQLFGRMYGTNNFPDSSNMCHESTSVALPDVIGVPVGTVLLAGFRTHRLHLLLRPQHHDQCAADAASAAGSCAAGRSDHYLQSVARARTGTFHQSAKSGADDRGAAPGSARSIIRSDSAATPRQSSASARLLSRPTTRPMAQGGSRIVDVGFINEHTSGFDEFAAFCRASKLD